MRLGIREKMHARTLGRGLLWTGAALLYYALVRYSAAASGVSMDDLSARMLAAAYLFAPPLLGLSMSECLRAPRARRRLVLASFGWAVGALIAFNATKAPVPTAKWPDDLNAFTLLTYLASNSKPFGYTDIEALSVGWFAKLAMMIGFETVGGMLGSAAALLAERVRHSFKTAKRYRVRPTSRHRSTTRRPTTDCTGSTADPRGSGDAGQTTALP